MTRMTVHIETKAPSMCPLQRGFISKSNMAAPSGNGAKRTRPSALSIIQKKSLHISSSGLLQVSLLRGYTVSIQLTVSVPESNFSAENCNHAEEQQTTTSNYQLGEKKKKNPLHRRTGWKRESKKGMPGLYHILQSKHLQGAYWWFAGT